MPNNNCFHSFTQKQENNKRRNREKAIPMAKQEINDDKRTIWLEKVCPPYDICNLWHRDQSEALHFSICYMFKKPLRGMDWIQRKILQLITSKWNGKLETKQMLQDWVAILQFLKWRRMRLWWQLMKTEHQYVYLGS